MAEIALHTHFVVEQPMSWAHGDVPMMIFSPAGKPVGMFKHTADGALVPVTGHFLITSREPPDMHLILDGIICYAQWFVTVDRTA